VLGRPFPKGVSGNPGGRPKGLAVVERLARERGPAAIERLTELMGSGDERVALTACVALLDRGYGKPRQFDEERLERVVEQRLKGLIAEAEQERDLRAMMFEGAKVVVADPVGREEVRRLLALADATKQPTPLR